MAKEIAVRKDRRRGAVSAVRRPPVRLLCVPSFIQRREREIDRSVSLRSASLLFCILSAITTGEMEKSVAILSTNEKAIPGMKEYVTNYEPTSFVLVLLLIFVGKRKEVATSIPVSCILSPVS